MPIQQHSYLGGQVLVMLTDLDQLSELRKRGERKLSASHYVRAWMISFRAPLIRTKAAPRLLCREHHV